MDARSEELGLAIDGRPLRLATLQAGALTARITNYGATLMALSAPDRHGHAADVTLGYDRVEDLWHCGSPYFGSTVGRYANRIGGAKFRLAGREWLLTANHGPHQIHGGIKGFDKQMWDDELIEGPGEAAVRYRRVSEDGEEGFPGRLEVAVTYRLSPAGLRIDYEARTDKPTHVNLTNHAYFNLAGQGEGDVLGHLLEINGRHVTATDAEIPTGALLPVEGTPLDFRSPRAIGERIGEDFAPLRDGGGYDQNYVLAADGERMEGLLFAARVTESLSGRVLEVWTDQPGVQFYTGNLFNGSMTGKGGSRYVRHAGFCLETQHYPDTPNRPEFPPTRLDPGGVYRTSTLYRLLTA